MSSDDEHPPKELLRPILSVRTPLSSTTSSSMAAQQSSMAKKPYQITFPSRDEEIQYTRKIMENCSTFDGDPDQLHTWLKETGIFLAREGYPETDHPFIIRHLLTDDALNYYQAHEDIIFNFYDLRKLFLLKQNTLAPLRTVSSLDSLALFTVHTNPPVLTSTQLPSITTTNTGDPAATTTFTFAQSLEDLTQNDIRKTIIEDLQRNTPKFTGDHRQDIVKWLKNIERKFDAAGIPASKRLDLISQLFDKGALDWFYENKGKFNNSWSDFVDLLKSTFDSPNRARIAMQKLHSYTQSPYQDVRSFCREMRKLFQEADTQMSSSMKLELLLAKVNPSYRLDLLKQKPKDPAEFETMAKDIENTYLVYDAIAQNTPSNISSSSAPYPSFPAVPPSLNFQRSPGDIESHPNNHFSFSSHRSDPRFTGTAAASPRSSTSNSYVQYQPSQRSSFPHRPSRGSYNVRGNPRSNLSTYHSLSSRHHPPSSTAHNIPPLMSSISSDVYQSPHSLPMTSPSSLVICQLCSSSGHSARDCPF